MGRKPINPDEPRKVENYSLGVKTIERLNRVAQSLGRKRSQIVEEAINEKLDRLDKQA